MHSDGYLRNARLKTVVDGNTVRLVVDLGFRIFTEMSIRLTNVDAPKLYRASGVSEDEWAKGKESREFLVSWFNIHNMCKHHKFWPIILESTQELGFGRFMGRIYCRDGHCLNDDVINNGLAKKYVEKING